MDAPPNPRLGDLVHAFNGIVVEQFKKSRKTPQLFDSSLAIVKATSQNSTKLLIKELNRILFSSVNSYKLDTNVTSTTTIAVNSPNI